MQRTLTLLSLISFFAVLPLIALAHEDGTAHPHDENGNPIPVNAPPELRPIDKLRQERAGLMQEKKEVKQDIKGVWVDTKNKVIDLRTDTKAQMENATTPEERKAIREEHVEARGDIRADRLEAVKPLRQNFRDLARKHLHLAGERFRMALAHLTKIEARIDSRLDKLADSGVDVSTAVSALATASTAIDKAEADAQAVKTYVDGIAEGADPQTVRTEIAALVKTANASLKAAYQALRVAIEALKALPKPQTSTSVETEVETGTTSE